MNSPSAAEDVRDFYSRHPYPPPVKSLGRYREKWNDPQRRKAEFHLFEPAKPFNGRRKILVAGCGTSQAAKYALRWPSAQITGIDVSATSIEQTQLLKQTYKLKNLTLHEMPIEQVTDLDQSFDHVASTGVLHHLPDPDKGLQALRDILLLNGSMHIMVYAPYGRAGIYLIQDYCRRLGIGTSSEEIGDLAECIGQLPPNHPLVPILRAVPDADQEAALADALLNPQDRPYSVEEFFDFLNLNGLQFGRWIRQAEYSALCGSLRSSPHAKLFNGLSNVETFAAVELYRGTLMRHSAVVYRKDMAENAQPIRFDTNDWLNYVPIRQPTTVCVRERIPEGAAAVLINRAHTQTDIYLPVNKEQLRLFERIDGHRPVTKIVGSTCDRIMACDFFEALWQHDQIVFDASGEGT